MLWPAEACVVRWSLWPLNLLVQVLDPVASEPAGFCDHLSSSAAVPPPDGGERHRGHEGPSLALPNRPRDSGPHPSYRWAMPLLVAFKGSASEELMPLTSHHPR